MDAYHGSQYILNISMIQGYGDKSLVWFNSQLNGTSINTIFVCAYNKHDLIEPSQLLGLVALLIHYINACQLLIKNFTYDSVLHTGPLDAFCSNICPNTDVNLDN